MEAESGGVDWLNSGPAGSHLAAGGAAADAGGRGSNRKSNLIRPGERVGREPCLSLPSEAETSGLAASQPPVLRPG